MINIAIKLNELADLASDTTYEAMQIIGDKAGVTELIDRKDDYCTLIKQLLELTDALRHGAIDSLVTDDLVSWTSDACLRVDVAQITLASIISTSDDARLDWWGVYTNLIDVRDSVTTITMAYGANLTNSRVMAVVDMLDVATKTLADCYGESYTYHPVHAAAVRNLSQVADSVRASAINHRATVVDRLIDYNPITISSTADPIADAAANTDDDTDTYC